MVLGAFGWRLRVSRWGGCFVVLDTFVAGIVVPRFFVRGPDFVAVVAAMTGVTEAEEQAYNE